MYTHIHSVDWLLWFVASVIELGCLSSIFRNKHHQFAQAAYLAFSLARSAIVLCIAFLCPYDAYYYAFWALAGVEMFFQYGVAWSVFRQLFEPFDTLPTNTLSAAGMALTVLLALIIGTSIFRPAQNEILAVAIARTFDKAAAMSVAAVFLLIIAFSQALGLPYRKPLFGIVAGWSFFICLHVFRASALVILGRTDGLGHADIVAYIVGASVWWWYLSRPEPESQKISIQEAKIMLELARAWRKRAEQRSCPQ